jgi:hypothetical protein
MTEGKTDGQVGVKTGPEGNGQESPWQPAGEASAASKRARQVNSWRATTLVLGMAAVTSAFVLWLVPTSRTNTTTAENTTTTVIDSAGHKSATEVKKLTATTMPGVARSDAMLVAVLTFGVGLLFAASLWNRIQEFAFGGVSIKLADAAVAPPEIALIDAAAVHVESLFSTSADMIASEVDRISKNGQGLVQVDLQQGNLWAPTNLCLFVLLLANRSRAEVVVFTGQDSAGPERYLGAASVGRLADRLVARDPVLAAAYRASEPMPLVRSPETAQSLGDKFFAELRQKDAAREHQTDRVDPMRLYALAGQALITASVEGSGEQSLSKEKQREILAFPLSYVPITYRGRLDEVVDKGQLAEKIASSAVGLSG